MNTASINAAFSDATNGDFVIGQMRDKGEVKWVMFSAEITSITMSDTRKLLTVLQCVDPKGLPFTEQIPDDCTEYTSLRVVRRQSAGMNDDIDKGRAEFMQYIN